MRETNRITNGDMRIDQRNSAANWSSNVAVSLTAGFSAEIS